MFRKVSPNAYIDQFLSNNERPSGRAIEESREPIINVLSNVDTSLSVALRAGETFLVSGLKAECAQPTIEKPDEGFLAINLEISSMASPKFKNGPPSSFEQALSHRLQEVILKNGIIDLKSLCIEPSKACWAIYIDLICLNYDGNLFDLALLATMAALVSIRLPKAEWDGDQAKAIGKLEQKSPLDIKRCIFSSTFLISPSKKIIADPCSIEEEVIKEKVTVILDDKADFRSIETEGGLNIKTIPFDTCIELAKERTQKYHGILISLSQQ